MRIELLGTGGFFANNRRHTPCLLLPELGIVLDAGSGAFRLPSRWTTPELDVFITHAHIDHIIGLTYLMLPIVQKRIERVRVHAEPVVLDAIRTHLYSQPLFPVAPPFECCPLEPTGLQQFASGWSLHWQPLPSHPGGSMAFRLDHDGQPRLAYVTDTLVDGSYTEFIRGVDLLIHECYFPDDKAELARLTGHSLASDVGRLARTAVVAQLVLTHVDPDQDVDDPIDLAAVRAHFPAAELAVDGMTLTIPD